MTVGWKSSQAADPAGKKNELRLIHRAQNGDREACRQLIDLHKDRLYAFVSRTVRNHHDAEEVCQDAFLKAFGSLKSFDTRFRFSTWLFTIGYRLSLNLLRRKRSVTGEVDFSAMSSPDPRADESAAQSEEAKRLRKLIWEAVHQLTAPQQAAVVLFYQHEMGCAEIADVLDLPVATVKSHLHRARARLRDMLEPVMADDSSRLRILADLAG